MSMVMIPRHCHRCLVRGARDWEEVCCDSLPSSVAGCELTAVPRQTSIFSSTCSTNVVLPESRRLTDCVTQTTCRGPLQPQARRERAGRGEPGPRRQGESLGLPIHRVQLTLPEVWLSREVPAVDDVYAEQGSLQLLEVQERSPNLRAVRRHRRAKGGRGERVLHGQARRVVALELEDAAQLLPGEPRGPASEVASDVNPIHGHGGQILLHVLALANLLLQRAAQNQPIYEDLFLLTLTPNPVCSHQVQANAASLGREQEDMHSRRRRCVEGVDQVHPLCRRRTATE
mmetsp:Transcript_73224/g.214670  ORF Transcript_73224/g.214670 Transcript_73224/m.214670 type:complete len:287 (+) Transcript_73224:697-1557(+)